MKRPPQRPLLYVLMLVLSVLALPMPAQTERVKAADSEGVTASRNKTSLFLEVSAKVKSPIKIPRLAAPVASMMWQGSITDDGVSLKPEPDHWVISWKNRPAENATLVLQFGSQPILIDELKPIRKSGDGSFYLPAHFAQTHGEKIRYEPQPHKNTVGFWVGKEDYARWGIQLDKPGRFNVAVLQGCGKGQGGSSAVMSFVSPVKDLTPKLEFEVVETGHFQNFQWVHLGEVELRHAGEVEISVAPKQIKKAALMDIRAIHLIRLPDKKK
ncbi:MAG: hypothetical protein AAF085_07630 [Planctomycetota bacterium]